MEHCNILPKIKSCSKRYRSSTGESEDEDYDDTPLFTRDTSYKLVKQDSVQEDDSAKSQIKEVEDCLPNLQASLFATVLEDSITQLYILDEGNNKLRIIKALSDKDFLKLKKFSVPQPTVSDEFSYKDVKKLEDYKHKLNKLETDRKYCTGLLIATYLDLAMRKCHDALINANIVEIQQNEQYNRLLEDEAKNKLIRRELVKQFRQQHNYSKSVLYDTNVTIEGIKSEIQECLIQDLNLVSAIQGRYIDNWQLARSEQNTQNITDKEIGVSNSIKQYRGKQELELRVHAEEALTKVEHWMNKFDIDMERMDLKIQLMKNKYQAQTEDRIEMEQTLEIHGKDIEAWLRYKNEREKARQYAMKMTKAAIAVQSWWRGLLVRLQLGPFKPIRRKAVAARKV